MSAENPFQSRFQVLSQAPACHADLVNQHAYSAMRARLCVPVAHPGRCLMLRSPRAGYGKTHLLAQLQCQMGATHEFIAIDPVGGCQVDARTVAEGVFRRLSRVIPATGGVTVLDLVARRWLSLGLLPLLKSGEVPSHNLEDALAALQNRPIQTMDFHDPGAVTAHWTRDHFALLGPRMCAEIAQQASLPAADVAFWVDVLFRYATQPLGYPARGVVVNQAIRMVMEEGSGGLDRLGILLSLLCHLTRLVLVVDELEGLAGDQAAALRLASYISQLQQRVERIDVIVSVNRDVWEGTFAPRLGSGLRDRLEEVVIELEPMNEAAVMDLLEARSKGSAGALLAQSSDPSALRSAREWLLAACESWPSLMHAEGVSPSVRGANGVG
jgi:hypothetical protein